MSALALFVLIACEPESGFHPDANEPPFCPTGADVFDGYVVCGTCTRVHQEGECAPGYVCTCSGACTWWVGGFPLDAQPGCGLDASSSD